MASKFKALAVTTAMTAGALCGGASMASAGGFDLTGGAFTGTATSQATFTLGGAYTIGCDLALTGDTEGVPGNTAAATVDPVFSNCDYFGFLLDVTVDDSWELEAKSTNGAGRYYFELRMPAGAAMNVAIPIIGCEWQVSAPQTVTHGAGSPGSALYGDNGTPFRFYADMYNVSYTTNGFCPFGPGSDWEFHTNGSVEFDGFAVDEL